MFDVASVLGVAGLVLLFAFLTFRARRVKNSWLKWAGVLLGGAVTLISAGVLAFGLAGFARLNARHANPAADIQVARAPEQIARGEQLAHTCVSCHTANNELPLAGVNFGAKFGMPPMGTLYAPNLTPSGNIQGWTDGELIRAIREGVHQNGRSLLIMPADSFRNLSDADVQALVAYIRSQPPSGGPTPDNQLNVLGALFVGPLGWLTAQPPVGQVTAPQPGTPGYGKYMVDIIGCRGCHGDQLEGKAETGAPGPPPGPNLTQIVPGWTEEQFMTFFNTGVRPDGSPVPTLTLPSGYTEPQMPWITVRASTTDAELHDIYTYRHSLPPAAGPAK